jgi:hypothetical protein
MGRMEIALRLLRLPQGIARRSEGGDCKYDGRG